MYCSGVWSYIVGAIATPFFIAVPLVTIWAGIFPIVVSKWAASELPQKHCLCLQAYELCQELKVLSLLTQICLLA